MPERKFLLLVSLIVVVAGFGATGYLAINGMLLHIEGLSLGLIALTVAVTFAAASAPELVKVFPLPPAVDESAHPHEGGGGIPLYMKVWGALLILTMVEVGLAYMKLAVGPMLIALMGLSIMKAAMIIAYFMHLRFERLSMVLILMPALVMCMCLLGVFFPDSNRMLRLGQDRQPGHDIVSVPSGAPETPVAEK